ncbi:MAG TPA: dihydroneopterin aldolase, partial [Chthoniobacterales bacterium]
MTDQILIRGLEVFARIGITPEERAEPQRLRLDVEIEPAAPFAELDEQISRTVDYYRASLRLAALAGSR